MAPARCNLRRPIVKVTLDKNKPENAVRIAIVIDGRNVDDFPHKQFSDLADCTPAQAESWLAWRKESRKAVPA